LDLRLEITLTAALPRDGEEREICVGSVASHHEVEVRMTGAWQWRVKNKQLAGRPAIAADYYVTAALHFPGLLYPVFFLTRRVINSITTD